MSLEDFWHRATSRAALSPMRVIKPPHFTCVLAMDRDRGIGRRGTIPWDIPEDRAHARRLTMRTRTEGARNAVIMGRRTWDALPARMQPLLERINIVVTGRPLPPPRWQTSDLYAAFSLSDAIATAMGRQAESIHVIGGGQAFEEALADPCCEIVYCTRIRAAHDCDRFVPRFEDNFQMIDRSMDMRSSSGTPYTFEVWARTR